MAYVTGDRRLAFFCTCTATCTFGQGSAANLVDEISSLDCWWNNQSAAGIEIKWDFGSGHAYTITEAVYTADNATSHGTWKWQGSQDNSSWTDIGSSFTLGGASTQTLTGLNGNSTAYRYYRLLGISGSMSNSPFVFGIRPTKHDGPWIRFSQNGTLMGGGNEIYKIIDGTTNHGASGPFFNVQAVANQWLKFDFGQLVAVREAKWYQSGTDSHGTWKWQGSTDDSSYSDIGSSFTFGGTTTQTQTELNGNASTYRYYRLLGVSGNSDADPFLYEIEFDMTAGGGGGGSGGGLTGPFRGPLGKSLPGRN